MLGVQALCPTFTLAAVVYLVRVQMALVSMPIRQSYVMGVTEERSRSVVSAFSGLPAQLTSAVSPDIGTYFMETWTIDAPLWLATFFQLVNAGLYYALLKNEAPPEERAAQAAAVANEAAPMVSGERPAG